MCPPIHAPSPDSAGTPPPPASLLMTIPQQLSPQKQRGSPSLRPFADNQEKVLISETVEVGKGNEAWPKGHMEPV